MHNKLGTWQFRRFEVTTTQRERGWGGRGRANFIAFCAVISRKKEGGRGRLLKCPAEKKEGRKYFEYLWLVFGGGEGGNDPLKGTFSVSSRPYVPPSWEKNYLPLLESPRNGILMFF